MRRPATIARVSVLVLIVAALAIAHAEEDSPYTYEDFASSEDCAMCHIDIARQHEQALMSQSFTHHWDEIEYFELALPHARKEAKVAEIETGCNGCHAPLAVLVGDIPPKRPSEGTMANEGVACDLCHSITGFKGDVPFNFNWEVSVSDVKFGPRDGVESIGHEVQVNPFYRTAEFCGTCHNEKDPWGLWVKATHLEWKESPQAKAGIVCQDCHMPPVEAASAVDAEVRKDMRTHLFHGAHDDGKLAGVIEVRIHPEEWTIKPGKTARLTANLVNAKAGHMVPSGSVEERVLWLHVEARDAKGKVFHLPVDAKGFEGESFTIASADAMAYQDIGDIKGLDGFPGLKRDGDVPAGDRIFRMPYFDPQGRMTVAQWNTASFGADYRLAPLVAVNETFTWKLPADLPPGKVEVTASVYYSRLVSSVADYLGVPEEEAEPVLVSEHRTRFEVTPK
jgi:hypothetical protein